MPKSGSSADFGQLKLNNDILVEFWPFWPESGISGGSVRFQMKCPLSNEVSGFN